MPPLPTLPGNFETHEASKIWSKYHQYLEVYFGSITFREWGGRSPVIFRTSSGGRHGFSLSMLVTREVFSFIRYAADNTAVHLGSLADINIYRALLRQYSLATKSITNFSKSEAVLCGKWRSDSLAFAWPKPPST
jgi:hypothetical protein